MTSRDVWLLLIVLLYQGNIFVNGQISPLGCPLDWVSDDDSCYQFVFHDELSYEDASISCWTQGSGLVSVNTLQEHNFIKQYLNRHGIQSVMGWYTGGQIVGSEIKWYGDGTFSDINQYDHLYWNSETRNDTEANRIIYKISYIDNNYGWTTVLGTTRRNYMCEIPKNEVYRIIQLNRDFDFGLPAGVDSAMILQGPKLYNDIEDVVVVETNLPLVIDCVATGNPQPNYQWRVKDTSGDQFSNSYHEINQDTSTRYTFSNGRLTISSPQETEDAGIYQCMAENSQGSILSPPLTIYFGYLHEFSPNQQGFVEATQGQGTFLSCNPPNAKPGLVYTWYKETVLNFIRPELDKFYFISSNGNLYLSETQESNGGNYFCVVTLVANPGERLSTNQPPSRTSRAIELRMPGNPSIDYGPIIHPDFIAVFPNPPLIGYDVRLECFAYGRLPLQYSWSREGSEFPAGTKFLYDNRVMFIPNAQLDAAGNYTCSVLKLAGKRNTASQKITLFLESKPFFIYPMRNIHADIGSKLTWRCEAHATPRATYRWYKNSMPLEHVPGKVEIRENILTMLNLDKTLHEGMYQCEATNVHGTAITTAELRVLTVMPTFSKKPLPDSLQTSEGGNLTIPCEPEAAPHPDITWLHNGQPIGFGDSRRGVLMDGTLQVTEVTFSDQGVYTCKAENIYGVEESSTRVSVVTGARFLSTPLDQTVSINQTAFLYCDVTYDFSNDLIYSWKFNGHLIDTKDHPFYRQGIRGVNSGLYIINAQYAHSGVYECLAQTVFVSLSSKATVEVTGPPSAPAGVFIEPAVYSNGSVRLMWTWNPAANHGYPVTYFDIEAITEFTDQWSVIKMDIPHQLTVIPNADMKHFYDIEDLLPYNSYRFRVRAKNAMGVGQASGPSMRFKVMAAKPTTAPRIINTGGGVEGLLQMEWLPLSRSEEGGPGFGYKVYWKQEAETQKGFLEQEVGNVSSHFVTVGQDYYYLQYLVKVQAYNAEGYGPIGPEAVVYSAEGMPPTRPANIRCDAVNATAVEVSWDPVPDTREALKGAIAGYEVFYVGDEDLDDTGGVIVYGQTDHGVIIGLVPNTNYWVTAVVFNGAGPSVLSDTYLCETSLNPPGSYPLYVSVFDHGPQSVRVQWRGVQIVAGEGSLVGYKVMYWPVGDDIRTANYTMEDRVAETVVYGIMTDKIYNLRVMAVNDGGEGKKSPTIYFSLLKDGSISVDQSSFDPSTSEIMASGSSNLLQYLPTLLASLTILVPMFL